MCVPQRSRSPAPEDRPGPSLPTRSSQPARAASPPALLNPPPTVTKRKMKPTVHLAVPDPLPGGSMVGKRVTCHRGLKSRPGPAPAHELLEQHGDRKGALPSHGRLSSSGLCLHAAHRPEEQSEATKPFQAQPRPQFLHLSPVRAFQSFVGMGEPRSMPGTPTWSTEAEAPAYNTHTSNHSKPQASLRLPVSALQHRMPAAPGIHGVFPPDQTGPQFTRRALVPKSKDEKHFASELAASPSLQACVLPIPGA
ncbi:uncharacterized protein LOC120234692 [Hyaena hyaena]|uniref:uncharacterized protein LOC120234692 n=1 Tax=Hyaena hyaena TaxID=95912 RepID=UPI0019247077|nr:uncharacterized protein LOC120234692 [Hyaena hyaena]